MFSFRTSPIEEQLDKALREGRVACFCTQNSFHPESRKYLYEIFRERGNLAAVFSPSEAELSPHTKHIDFKAEDLEDLSAVVVEIQDAGCRYFNFTRDVMRLLSTCARMENAPAVYIIDHINPAGRVVEGSIPAVESDIWTPKVAHRHGLTLGELCLLYCSEIGAKFPLHVISAACSTAGRDFLPWAIAPSSDICGMFTCEMYSGAGLWNNTNICPGIGTSRPYEYFGAPFIINDDAAHIPAPDGVVMRPCSFTPSTGIYEGRRCQGYQIMLLPGVHYHSLLHTLLLMRFFKDAYPQFEMKDSLFVKLADPVCEEYLRGSLSYDVVQEHIKAEEQKWIRMAKRYCLYDDAPYRMK